MWNRKTMKRDARADLRTNYLQCIMVSLVVMALMGSYGLVHSSTVSTALQVVAPTTNTGILDTFFSNLFGQDIAKAAGFLSVNDASQGLLAGFVNNASQAGSLLTGALNMANQLFFGDSLVPAILMGVGALIYALYWFFVQNLLIVGQHRFFLENRCYHESKSDRLFFVFRVHRVWRVAFTMFLSTLFTVLWALTLVGGVVMLYAYRMVPAILAENPDLSPTAVLTLSRQLMRGNKWAAFKLDLSFLGWNLLSILTFRLLSVLFVTPYSFATNAELYMQLRDKYLAETPDAARYFTDQLLEIPRKDEKDNEYPTDRFTIPYNRGAIIANHEHTYSLVDLVMLFFSYAMVGYLYEVVYYVIRDGLLINRGTLYGPWLPIYGFGGVISLVLLRRFAGRPVRTFFLSMLVCGVLEYATAWFLETFMHTKWWDYTGFFLNIQGRVCLEGLIVFGLGCCLSIYVLSPSLANLFAKIPLRVRIALSCALATAFLGDVAFSAFHPNVSGGDPTFTEGYKGAGASVHSKNAAAGL